MKTWLPLITLPDDGRLVYIKRADRGHYGETVLMRADARLADLLRLIDVAGWRDADEGSK